MAFGLGLYPHVCGWSMTAVFPYPLDGYLDIFLLPDIAIDAAGYGLGWWFRWCRIKRGMFWCHGSATPPLPLCLG